MLLIVSPQIEDQVFYLFLAQLNNEHVTIIKVSLGRRSTHTLTKTLSALHFLNNVNVETFGWEYFSGSSSM